MQETNFDYEVVIMEDCSTDSTRDIVIDYQRRNQKNTPCSVREEQMRQHQLYDGLANLSRTIRSHSGWGTIIGLLLTSCRSRQTIWMPALSSLYASTTLLDFARVGKGRCGNP